MVDMIRSQLLQFHISNTKEQDILCFSAQSLFHVLSLDRKRTSCSTSLPQPVATNWSVFMDFETFSLIPCANQFLLVSSFLLIFL